MQSQASRIRWNSFFAFLSQLIRLLTNFLMFVGIARFYGPEAFGQFTTAHTLSTIFLLFADFGFDTLLATEIARDRGNAASLARQYFSLKIIFAACATVAMMLFPLVKNFSPETTLLIRVFALYVLFSSLNNFFFALFKGFEQFHHETKISFGINLVLFLFLIVLGFLRAPLYVIAVSFVSTRILGLIIGANIASRLAKFRLQHIDLTNWRGVWRKVVIFGLYALFGNLFFLIDTVLLSLMKGDREVGIYQAVFKLVILALILQDIATNTMLPVLSRLHEYNKDQWETIGRILNKTLLFISIPVAMALFVYPDQIIQFVYGSKDYGEAIPILRLFSIVILVRYGVEAYAVMLTTSLRHSTRVVIVSLATVINIIINFLLIPLYGPWGAAVTSLVTNLLVGTCYVVASKISLLQWSFQLRNVLVIIFSIIAAVVLWSLRSVSMWYTSPVMFVAYMVTLYFVGYTREEWKLIFNWRQNFAVV